MINLTAYWCTDLIKSIFPSIADVHQLDDLGLESLVEHVGLGQLGLEVCGPGQDQPRHVGLVVGQEELDGRLGHLPHVVVTLLHPQPGEPQGGLSSSSVLLGQIHGELVKNISSVALITEIFCIILTPTISLTCKVPKRAPLPSMTINPNLLSSARRAVRASVWNLLSQRYREVLIALNGSKSILTFFSFPSSVTIVPQ